MNGGRYFHACKLIGLGQSRMRDYAQFATLDFWGHQMKSLLRTATGLAAFASLSLLPAPAAAQTAEYDTALYDLMLDCATLQVIFASAGKNDAEKTDSANMGAAYLMAAETLSGTQIADLGKVLTPRRERIMGWITSKNPNSMKLVKSCASIFTVHKNYSEMKK